MSERHAIRTAEAWLAEQDARLSRAKPRPDQPTAQDWREGFRDGILFTICMGIAVYAMLSIGG